MLVQILILFSGMDLVGVLFILNTVQLLRQTRVMLFILPLKLIVLIQMMHGLLGVMVQLSLVNSGMAVPLHGVRRQHRAMILTFYF